MCMRGYIEEEEEDVDSFRVLSMNKEEEVYICTYRIEYANIYVHIYIYCYI